MAERDSIVCVYHIFFFHSPIHQWTLRSYLAIVNEAAVNKEIPLERLISFPWNKYPDVGFLHHGVVLLFSQYFFEKASYQFP